MLNKLNILLILFALSTQTNAQQEVWTFSTSDNQIKFTNQAYLSSWQVKYYTVDGASKFEALLSKGLSSDINSAKKQIKAKMTKNKQQLTQQAKTAWQGIINASSLGIERIPAVTFDNGATVIYGVFDLLEAYRIWLKEKIKNKK